MSPPRPRRSARPAGLGTLLVILLVAALAAGAVLALHRVSGPSRAPVAAAPGSAGPLVLPTPQADGVDPAGPPAAPLPPVTALPRADPVRCPPATVTVTTAEQLGAALHAAAPGTSIAVADGTYAGRFLAQSSGTPQRPVWLCGGRGAVLDGGGTTGGYALHLAPAAYWRVVGLTVRDAQKGVVADGTRGTVLQDLLVEHTGDEGIHLRSGSTGDLVLHNTVRETGLREPRYGEGIYVGSAESNWAQYGDGGGPDRSDLDRVEGNAVSGTTAESVDVKEGTTGGALVGNTFDGSAMTDADSWVDVKGNGWLVTGNTGSHTPKDGFQTHQVVAGWGTGNTFRGNVAVGRSPDVDIYVHKPRDTRNTVRCDNRDGGGPATSNTPCRA